MKTNPNEPINATDAWFKQNGELTGYEQSSVVDGKVYGLTKREELAKSAMIGILSVAYADKRTIWMRILHLIGIETNGSIVQIGNLNEIAEISVKAADQLIAELNRTQD